MSSLAAIQPDATALGSNQSTPWRKRAFCATVADRLGIKPSELDRIVRLATQERERGNVLVHEKALIEVAEQLV